MIFAKVDVSLRDHPKADAAGAAMGTWLWGLLFARGHESDGHVPGTSIRKAWVGERQARKDAADLVSAGLWAPDPGGDGWRICRYDAKNETKSGIEERRGAVRDRVAKFRSSRNALQPHPVTEIVTRDSVASVPDSDSDSDSDSDLKIGSDREILPGGTDPPAWWDGACETVEAATGVQLSRAAAWLRYHGHRRTNGKPLSASDAQYWLTTVDVREAAQERRREQAFRDSRHRRDDPPKPPQPTPAQSKAMAAELAERMRAAFGGRS